MFCSNPSSKFRSNWFHRLRSKKGITTGDELDLDAFLTQHPDSLHSNFDSTPQKQPLNQTPEPEIPTTRVNPSLSCVLADLFHLGTNLTQSSNLPGKKHPRKQTKPKFVVVPLSCNCSIHYGRNDDNVLPINSFNSNVKEVKEDAFSCEVLEKEKQEKEEEAEEEDIDGQNLKGFSRSEVTMLDTSCPGWKVEKLVFRKNLMWKLIVDKRRKSKFFAKKRSSIDFKQMGETVPTTNSLNSNVAEFKGNSFNPRVDDDDDEEEEEEEEENVRDGHELRKRRGKSRFFTKKKNSIECVRKDNNAPDTNLFNINVVEVKEITFGRGIVVEEKEEQQQNDKDGYELRERRRKSKFFAKKKNSIDCVRKDNSEHDPNLFNVNVVEVKENIFGCGIVVEEEEEYEKDGYELRKRRGKFTTKKSCVICEQKDVVNILSTNSFNSNVVEDKEDTFDSWVMVEEEEEEENDNEYNELRGFLRSEVTMIDTSCSRWKVDKLVFRKNNVWKVREGRGKSRFSTKKKKVTLVDNGSGDENILMILEHQLETNLEMNTEHFITSSTQGQHTQHEEMMEACKETQDII